MRSLAEIKFRLQQEAINLYLLWRSPSFDRSIPDRLDLPDPLAVASSLRGSSYAVTLEALAQKVLVHQFPILGIEIETGPEIEWRRDYAHGKRSDTAYFKRIPYLNFQVVGDHKIIWELNRHQHLVLLAQAFLLTDRREFLAEIEIQLESWFVQNPYQRGINWASALEVAFRAISWIWIFHLVGNRLRPGCLQALTNGLYQHGLHLAANLSVYFSPNTHLQGEAVALFVIGKLLPQFREAARWRQMSERIVLAELQNQVKPDGSHFEQSTYYHVYALDFFLFFSVVSGRTEEMSPVLRCMAEYLNWLLGPTRQIGFFGDDDGGRLFHPYGERSHFGRATVATCGELLGNPEWTGALDDIAVQAAWWLGADALRRAVEVPGRVRGSRVFADSGAVFLEVGLFRLQMDCGPFGFGGGGHSHSDTLSLVLQFEGKSVLIDPGTYTYLGDLEARNWFRGSAAHNTVRADGKDQAESVNPFRWANKPQAHLVRLEETDEGWWVEGACAYRNILHIRKVLLSASALLVLDEIEGPEGEHECEQIWQLGPAAGDLHLATSAPNETKKSYFSPAYGQKREGSSLVARLRSHFPLRMAMRLSIEPVDVLGVTEAAAIFERLNKISSK